MYAIWSPEGVIRGGHLESRSKLVTVLRGTIYYAMIDMRPGPDMGKKYEFYLGDGEKSMGRSVLNPEGLIDCFIPVDGDAMTHQVGDRPYNKFDNMRTLDIMDPELGLSIPQGSKFRANEEGETAPVSFKEFVESIK